MAATSLKLPDALKERIATLVEGTNRTPHGFMVEAIEQATAREELRRRFGEEAALAEAETDKTRKAFEATSVFEYFEKRAQGKRALRPRPKAWRRSV